MLGKRKEREFLIGKRKYKLQVLFYETFFNQQNNWIPLYYWNSQIKRV